MQALIETGRTRRDIILPIHEIKLRGNWLSSEYVRKPASNAPMTATSHDGSCLFCRIASGEIRPHIVYEDSFVLAFLDAAPIREGHTQVIPRVHFEYFEDLPSELMMRVTALAQKIAKVQKQIYGAERVALLFTGGDIPHVHAHAVPMAEKTDITSRRYIAEEVLTFRPLPRASDSDLASTAAKLRNALGFGLS